MVGISKLDYRYIWAYLIWTCYQQSSRLPVCWLQSFPNFTVVDSLTPLRMISTRAVNIRSKKTFHNRYQNCNDTCEMRTSHHTFIHGSSPPPPFLCHSTPLLATEAHHGVHSSHFTLTNELLPLYYYAYPQPPPTVHASPTTLECLSTRHTFLVHAHTSYSFYNLPLAMSLIWLCAYLISSRISLSFVSS